MAAARLSLLSDRELLSRLADLVRRERETMLSVLYYLNEIERRRLHLKLGCASLFGYCTERLKYSASGACRRIQAARMIREHPEVRQLLETGELNLATVSILAPVLTPANKTELLGQARGKSQRDVEALVACHKPPLAYRDRVRPVCVRVPQDTATLLSSSTSELVKEVRTTSAGGNGSATGLHDSTCKTTSFERAIFSNAHDGSSESADPVDRPSGAAAPAAGATPTRLEKRLFIQFVASPEFMKKYDAVRALLSHRVPKGTFEEVFGVLIDEFLKKHDPARRIEKREARRTGRSSAPEGFGPPATIEPRENGPGTERGAGDRGHTGDHSSVNRRSRPPVSPKPREGSGSGGMTLENERRTAQRRSSPHAPAAGDEERTRHIPAAVRDQMFKRDHGRCTYVGVNGRRCDSTHQLQVDHIVPYSLGGTNELSNLRLLCATHNRIEARRLLGETLVNSRIRGKNQESSPSRRPAIQP